MFSRKEIERQKALLQQAELHFKPTYASKQHAVQSSPVRDAFKLRKLLSGHSEPLKTQSHLRTKTNEDGKMYDTSEPVNDQAIEHTIDVFGLGDQTSRHPTDLTTSGKLSSLADADALREMERQLNESRERRRAREREQREEREKLKTKMQKLAEEKDAMNQAISKLADRLVNAETQLNQTSSKQSADECDSDDDFLMIYSEMDLLMSLSRP